MKMAMIWGKVDKDTQRENSGIHRERAVNKEAPNLLNSYSFTERCAFVTNLVKKQVSKK